MAAEIVVVSQMGGLYLRRPDKTVMTTKNTVLKYSAGNVFKNSDGDVFIATRSGKIDTKKSIVASDWRYDRTVVTIAPDKSPKITNVKITGSVMTVGLSIPAAATDTSNTRRATKLRYFANINKLDSTEWESSKKVTTNVASSLSIDLDLLKNDSGKSIINWSQETKLWKVKLYVWLVNGKGDGPRVSYEVKFGYPAAPLISEITHDKNSGIISATITKPSEAMLRPCRSVSWRIQVTDSSKSWKVVRTVNGSFSGNSAVASIDLQERQLVDESRNFEVVFHAEAIGVCGRTSSEDVYRAAVPWVPTLKLSGKVSERAIFSVNLRSSAKPIKPVTGVRAQKLVSVDYKKSSEIPGDAVWSDVGPIDNGACTGISIASDDIRPAAGTVTWVRLKVWNDIEELWYNYSSPVRITDLETPAPVTPSAQGDNVYILQARILESGTEVETLLAWESDDTANYTELSWSERELAWKSTEQPDIFTFADATWDEGPITWGNRTYGSHAYVIISGLADGETYYISARRALIPDDDTPTTYGKYCTKERVTLSAESVAPTSVQLSPVADLFVSGEDMRFFWDYGSSAQQESWSLMLSNSPTGHVPSSSDTVILQGSDAMKQCTVPWARNGVASIQPLESTGTAKVYLRISVMGVTLYSPPVTINAASRPTASVSVNDVTSTSRAATVSTDTAGSILRMSIVADGTSWDMPDGTHRQASGEVVYSTELVPDWEQTQDPETYTYDVSIPEDVALVDGASYTCNCTVTYAGVSSTEAMDSFDVDYEHKAAQPSDQIVATAYDETDELGIRSLYVVLELAEPDGYQEGDVYDVYRVANEVAYPVAKNLSLDAVLTDMYAPFGDMAEYRVALRTPEGSVKWISATYSLIAKGLTESKFIRIDWPGSYVEIERGVAPSDSYTKPFEMRTHMDGSRAGHWGPSVQRTTSVSAQFVSGRDDESIRRLRELARYDGPCYMRTSDGIAMTCNVDVSISKPLGTARVDVSISATEIDDDSFGVDIEEEEDDRLLEGV